MESTVKPFNGQFVARRSFARAKEKQCRSEELPRIPGHYEARLVQVNGPIMVVRYNTGVELPLEEKGKLQLVRLLSTSSERSRGQLGDRRL